MICPSCGRSLEGNARFCGMCGHQLTGEEQRAAEASATQMSAAKSGPPAEPEDPYVGANLNNRFVIEAKLGEGGFGAVYRGKQLATGRKVAIKLLHPEMTRDDNVMARFRREGQVLCSLRDAHTITTYDFDQTSDGTLFIAMELLEGRSLHDIMHEEAPIQWRRMLKIMSEMCSSLEEAHALGIVHRDLKPENIYLEDRPGNPEFVKILDFGIAKVMRGDGIAGDMSPQLTATGQTLGTLEYMSPEQLMGKPLDGRSDIYGLGVVAFELMTGRLPFPDAVGPAALISAQLKKVPPTPSQAYPAGDIPPLVDDLIMRMLAKDKNQRFRDMTDLRREIDGILSTNGVGAQPSDGSGPLVLPQGPASGPYGQPAPMAQVTDPASGPVAHMPTPAPGMHPGQMAPGPGSAVPMMQTDHGSAPVAAPPLGAMGQAPGSYRGGPMAHGGPMGQPSSTESMIAAAKTGPKPWLIIVVALIIAGGAVAAALLLR